jgi:hypothetical protein
MLRTGLGVMCVIKGMLEVLKPVLAQLRLPEISYIVAPRDAITNPLQVTRYVVTLTPSE